MFTALFFIVRPIVSLLIAMVGIIALASYFTGSDLVSGFIDTLIPVKDQLVSSLKVIVPKLFDLFKGIITGV